MTCFQIGSRRTRYKILRFAGCQISAPPGRGRRGRPGRCMR